MAYQHVAIIQPFVAEALVAGQKQIETRFYQRRRPPLGQIRPGDTVHFKVSGGTLIGRAQVAYVMEFVALTPTTIDRLRRMFQPRVCAPPRYWIERRRCRFGLIIGLGPLRRPASGLVVPRQYGGGWLVLSAKGEGRSGGAGRCRPQRSGIEGPRIGLTGEPLAWPCRKRLSHPSGGCTE